MDRSSLNYLKDVQPGHIRVELWSGEYAVLFCFIYYYVGSTHSLVYLLDTSQGGCSDTSTHSAALKALTTGTKVGVGLQNGNQCLADATSDAVGLSCFANPNAAVPDSGIALVRTSNGSL